MSPPYTQLYTFPCITLSQHPGKGLDDAWANFVITIESCHISHRSPLSHPLLLLQLLPARVLL
jgi:hypothetical protein